MIVFFTHHFLNFENACVIFIHFDCTENWISNMGVGHIITKIIVYVETGYDFTKKLNVSASSSLFVIVLLLSFMHSLWKAFLEERGLNSFPKFSIISSNFVV